MKKKKPQSDRRPARPTRKAPKAASTADILLGGKSKAMAPRMRARVARKWAENHRNLLALRNQLLEQMGQLAQQANEETARAGMHMADAGTDSFDRDFALSLLSSDQNALYEIEEAIKRIENGTYGICELTGKPIPKARLAAIPWTRFSVQAQIQLEREGAVGRARFADLGTIEETSTTPSETDEEDEKNASE